MTTNLKARRKLSELFKEGIEVRFWQTEDGPVGARAPHKDEKEWQNAEGEPLQPPSGDEAVALWVQPPNPFQREMAMRDAQGARARALIRAKRDADSEEQLTILAFLADMSMETLIDYVLQSDEDTRRNDAIRETLAEEHWADVNDIQEALRQFDEMAEDELKQHQDEYDAVLERDSQFGKEVAERQAQLTEAARDVLKMRNRDDLERRALDKRSEIVGSQAFMYEYELQMHFYSCREIADNKALFWESAREFAEAHETIKELVSNANSLFISDGGEAKNSPGVASGSDSSEPPSEPETSDPSTPEEQTE